MSISGGIRRSFWRYHVSRKPRTYRFLIQKLPFRTVLGYSDHFVASFCRRRYSGTRKTRVYLPEFDLETTHHTTSRPAYLPEIRFACGLYAFFMLYCVECDTHEQARSRRLWPRGRGTREPPHIYPNTQAPAHGMCKKESCRKTYPEFSTVLRNA